MWREIDKEDVGEFVLVFRLNTTVYLNEILISDDIWSLNRVRIIYLYKLGLGKHRLNLTTTLKCVKGSFDTEVLNVSVIDIRLWVHINLFDRAELLEELFFIYKTLDTPLTKFSSLSRGIPVTNNSRTVTVYYTARGLSRFSSCYSNGTKALLWTKSLPNTS